MKTLVLAAGDPISSDRLAPHLPFDLVVAADAGASHAVSAGIPIDLVVGDLDSITGELLDDLRRANVRIESHPADKDATDLELAIDAACVRGTTEMVVAGGGGGRLDHLLGNVAVLADPRLPPITWVLGDATVYPVHDHRRISTNPGTIIGVVPTGGSASGVTLTGLRWPLSDAELPAVSSLGVSNVAENRSIVVSVKRGVLLVVVNE